MPRCAPPPTPHPPAAAHACALLVLSVQGSDTFAEVFAEGDDIVEALDGIGWLTPAAPALGSTRKMLQYSRARCINGQFNSPQTPSPAELRALIQAELPSFLQG